MQISVFMRTHEAEFLNSDRSIIVFPPFSFVMFWCTFSQPSASTTNAAIAEHCIWSCQVLKTSVLKQRKNTGIPFIQDRWLKRGEDIKFGKESEL